MRCFCLKPNWFEENNSSTSSVASCYHAAGIVCFGLISSSRYHCHSSSNNALKMWEATRGKRKNETLAGG